MFITEDIRYIGANDQKIDLFEGQYPVPKGMSYNSYAILDEKITIMDTVDAAFKLELTVGVVARDFENHFFHAASFVLVF